MWLCFNKQCNSTVDMVMADDDSILLLYWKKNLEETLIDKYLKISQIRRLNENKLNIPSAKTLYCR